MKRKIVGSSELPSQTCWSLVCAQSAQVQMPYFNAVYLLCWRSCSEISAELFSTPRGIPAPTRRLPPQPPGGGRQACLSSSVGIAYIATDANYDTGLEGLKMRTEHAAHEELIVAPQQACLSSSVGIAYIATDGTVQEANQAFGDLLGMWVGRARPGGWGGWARRVGGRGWRGCLCLSTTC